MDQKNLKWHAGNMTPEKIWPSISKVLTYRLMHWPIIGQHSDTLLADMLVLMQAESLSAMSRHTAYTRPIDVNYHILTDPTKNWNFDFSDLKCKVKDYWDAYCRLTPKMQKCVLCLFSFSGNKRISFEEFLPIFLSIGGKTSTNTSIEGFVDGLRVFDRDGNGQISAAELRHVLTGLGRVIIDTLWRVCIMGWVLWLTEWCIPSAHRMAGANNRK